MYEAMRCASMVSNVQRPRLHRWLTTPEILHAATDRRRPGHRLRQVGRIAPGYKADIVFLDLGR